MKNKIIFRSVMYKHFISIGQNANLYFADRTVKNIHKVQLNIIVSRNTGKSPDSSVGIALGYGLDDRASKVRFPVGAGHFSVYYRVQNGTGAHPASYPRGTRGSFPGGKAAGA
jgi:hypothetical protein